jgi:lambda repressor-like predicted transcriptional regulator
MNELAQVRKAADCVQTARTRLLASIVAAHEAGNALRAIAKEAGLSHEQVRLLLRKHQAS